MPAMDIVVNGLLQPGGTLQLDFVPAMSPGRVRVTLQPLGNAERLPDAPWLDESVSAPFDLPRPGARKRVHARVVAERLPDLPAALREEKS